MSIFIIGKEKEVSFPNTPGIDKVIFHFILLGAFFTTLIVDPGYLVSRYMIWAICLFFIIRLIYNWKFEYKTQLLYIFLALVFFITSSLPMNLFIWFSGEDSEAVRALFAGEFTQSAKNAQQVGVDTTVVSSLIKCLCSRVSPF